MPRGRESQIEIDRIKSSEDNLRYGDRGAGKTGSGYGIDGFGPGNKKGFGGGSMQKNPKTNPKPQF